MSGNPTIAGNSVFATSQDSHLYCLDLETGKVVWKFKTPERMSRGIAVFAGKVYFPLDRGRLCQIAADTGMLLHTFQSEEPGDEESWAGGAPIICDNTVFFTASDGHLFALDIATWDVRWKIRPSEGSWLTCGPATDGRRIFVRGRQGPNYEGVSAIVAIGRD
jgi:outer membrane protein assembly factor BamB